MNKRYVVALKRDENGFAPNIDELKKRLSGVIIEFVGNPVRIWVSTDDEGYTQLVSDPVVEDIVISSDQE